MEFEHANHVQHIVRFYVDILLVEASGSATAGAVIFVPKDSLSPQENAARGCFVLEEREKYALQLASSYECSRGL